MTEEMSEKCQKRCRKEHSGQRLTSTKTADEDGRINLMKSRDRRALDFITEFSSAPRPRQILHKECQYRTNMIQQYDVTVGGARSQVIAELDGNPI